MTAVRAMFEDGKPICFYRKDLERFWLPMKTDDALFSFGAGRLEIKQRAVKQRQEIKAHSPKDIYKHMEVGTPFVADIPTLRELARSEIEKNGAGMSAGMQNFLGNLYPNHREAILGEKLNRKYNMLPAPPSVTDSVLMGSSLAPR